MQKYLVISIVLVVCLALVACGGKREDGGKVLLDFGDVHFDKNSSQLKPEGKAELDKAAAKLEKSLRGKETMPEKYAHVLIEGHTDDTGTEAFNLKLSKDRADSVAKVLIDEKGFNKALFVTKGVGWENPKYPNTSDANREKNRRVLIVLIPAEKEKKQ